MNPEGYEYEIKGVRTGIAITLRMPFKEGVDLHGQLEHRFTEWCQDRANGGDSDLLPIKEDTLSDKYRLSFEHRLDALEKEVFKTNTIEDLPM